MSEPYDLIIRNGELVTSTETVRGDLAIRDGRIVALGRVDGQAHQTIDATGKLIMPDGLIYVGTWKDGRVEQGNFDDYEPLRMFEMPEIVTHILPSDRPIGGVGEPVLPPTAPAVCNAISRARGERVRELPLG